MLHLGMLEVLCALAKVTASAPTYIEAKVTEREQDKEDLGFFYIRTRDKQMIC